MGKIFELMYIDKDYLILSTILKAVIIACVFMAFLIDLYHGIKKSKEAGECTTSKGMVRTIEKGNKYLTMIFFAIIADVMWHIGSAPFLAKAISVLPIFSFVVGLLLIRIEWLSVKEKLDDKLMRKVENSSKDMMNVLATFAELYNKNPNIVSSFIEANKKLAEDEKVDKTN